MLELGSVQEILKTLKWVLTLGQSDVKDVKDEIDELIRELSASLTNLWDITTKVSEIRDADFTQERFEVIRDYFLRFYFGQQNVSSARTHCGNVERDVERIKFKLFKFLHTDIGRWKEVDDKLAGIVDVDVDILRHYDNCIDSLDQRLTGIKEKLDKGQLDTAKASYKELKRDLESDIRELNLGVQTMRQGLDHIRTIAG